jgi:hypothetical protein
VVRGQQPHAQEKDQSVASHQPYPSDHEFNISEDTGDEPVGQDYFIWEAQKASFGFQEKKRRP